jgi:hypothetical protein
VRRRGRQPTPGLNDLLLDYHTANATGSSDSDHRHLHDGRVAFRLVPSHRGSATARWRVGESVETREDQLSLMPAAR